MGLQGPPWNTPVAPARLWRARFTLRAQQTYPLKSHFSPDFTQILNTPSHPHGHLSLDHVSHTKDFPLC